LDCSVCRTRCALSRVCLVHDTRRRHVVPSPRVGGRNPSHARVNSQGDVVCWLIRAAAMTIQCSKYRLGCAATMSSIAHSNVCIPYTLSPYCLSLFSHASGGDCSQWDRKRKGRQGQRSSLGFWFISLWKACYASVSGAPRTKRWSSAALPPLGLDKPCRTEYGGVTRDDADGAARGKPGG